MSTIHLQIAKLLFPFNFKTGQEKCLTQLTTHPYNLWQAQTGFGKTLLSLCATLPYLLDPHHPIKQIIVFVRTKTQIFRFFDDVKKIADRYLQQQDRINALLNVNPYFQPSESINPFFALPLVSKKDLCVLESADEEQKIDCRVVECPLFKQAGPSDAQVKGIKKQFFDAVPQSSTDVVTLLSSSTNHKNCPYYTIRSLLPTADLVVTTQAWLYEPLRSFIEKLFFAHPSRTAIIVDETHNLKALFVKKVSHEFISSFMSKDTFSSLRSALEETFASHVIEPSSHRWFSRPDNLAVLMAEVSKELSVLNKQDPNYKTLKDLQAFLHDAGYFWFTEKDKQELGHIDFTPTTVQGKFLETSKIILMSGTIHPPEVFALVFQLNKFHIIAMPTQRRKVAQTVFASQLLTSKLDNRVDRLYFSLYRIIRELHSLNIKGHTFVFNPSNEFKEKMFQLLTEYNSEKHFTIRMEQDSKYNQSLIEELTTHDNYLVLATLNGSFNEGIEVKDPVTRKSKINLIIITGMPIQPPSIENYVIDQVYLRKYGKKLADFTRNLLPINQILQQTVGRGVRGEQDSAWVVCTDRRIMRYNIWEQYGVVNNIRDFELLKEGLQRYFEEVY